MRPRPTARTLRKRVEVITAVLFISFGFAVGWGLRGWEDRRLKKNRAEATARAWHQESTKDP